ncbi:DUF2685 domain-containing protein, partial [Enterococcus faecalis]|uniref:DUF2685 domain-containing protein n=1 Tax=Enterococcus faecalis TaxID=1351 RepID=UPI003985074C
SCINRYNSEETIMSDKICVVCKTPIDSALVVETDKGPVHPGPRYNYIKELPVSESSEEQLNETQLLL